MTHNTAPTLFTQLIRGAAGELSKIEGTALANLTLTLETKQGAVTVKTNAETTFSAKEGATDRVTLAYLKANVRSATARGLRLQVVGKRVAAATAGAQPTATSG